MILAELQEIREHPQPDESIFEAASECIRAANEIVIGQGIKPVQVASMTNPIQAIAIVNRFIILLEPERFLTVPEAAKVLSVSQAKVSEWIKAGRLQAVNVANQGKRPQYRIPREALANLQEPIKYKPKHL